MRPPHGIPRVGSAPLPLLAWDVLAGVTYQPERMCGYAITSAWSMWPACISSTRIKPATSEKPHARGPCDVHHVGLLSSGGRTPSPVRSEVAQSVQFHVVPLCDAP